MDSGLTDTREKLLEAKFHLVRMKEIRSGDLMAFKFSLSAFLSAAISVTGIMLHEYQQAKGFKEWFRIKRVEMNENEICNFLFHKRNINIHTKPVNLTGDVRIHRTGPVVAGTTMATVITHITSVTHVMSQEEFASSFNVQETTERPQWYFPGLQDREVASVCDEYIDILEGLVSECEERFVVTP